MLYSSHDISSPAVSHPEASVPTELDEYLFDLNGFLLLKAVLSPAEVAEANARIDAIPRDLPRGAWHDWVQREDHPEHRGTSYQQVYELGGVFERMIDHPRYLNYLLRFIGGHDTHDHYHGPTAIDENFFTIRGPGEAIPVHSGGHELCSRTGYRYHNGRFLCGEINILTAFTNIGPGDGATMVIPGSHKSNMIHPAFLRRDRVQEWSNDGGGSADGVEGAIEVHMRAGDMLLFVDALCHGSARRSNAGERRISVYRYGSGWNRTRFGHQPSPEMLARANPVARKIIQPRDPIRPPGTPARW
ncbi:phytanoyl-CoA dioxygenase family protein [Sphingopyxis sp.]|uniref:phytanoyl-CoA dioxygenase family protein n=1 Tax=Sphingopyxis sp. TaxID=1908224 RepID=UPI003D6C839B